MPLFIFSVKSGVKMNVVTIDGLPVYRAEINGDDTGMLCISLVDEPAVLRDFQKLSKQERDDRERVRQLYTVTDAERQIVRGVVMRSDFPIYRRDANGFEYYIIYKADTIREMAEKYLADNFQNRVNLDHEEGAYVDGVQLVQWFIKDTAAGIVPDGFDDCADGSLFAEFHVTDAEIWDAIKAGTYRGFSLEGVFDLAPEQDQHDVERIVEETRGVFSRLTQIFPNMKFSKFFNALRKSVEMRSATSDKGVIVWEGDDELKVGDELFVEDENGERTAAADDTYVLTDGSAVVVTDGKVADIIVNEAPAEQTEAPADEATEAAEQTNAAESVEAAEQTEAAEEMPADEVPAPDDRDDVESDDRAIEQLRKEMNEAYAKIDALEAALAELRDRVAAVENQPAAVDAHRHVRAAAQTTGDVHKDNLARILNARR